jgi:hypothetical protein
VKENELRCRLLTRLTVKNIETVDLDGFKQHDLILRCKKPPFRHRDIA